MTARYFLIVPKGLAAKDTIACAKTACATGDCASIVVHEGFTKEDVAVLQTLNLAVLLANAEARAVSHLKADGLHVSTSEFNLADLRKSLPKDAMLGRDCGTSRHAAMEAAEQGADYVGFRQNAQRGGEPLVSWWNDIAEIPAVPLDPAIPADAAILAKTADFLRPMDEMWQSPEMTARVIGELQAALK